MPHIDQITQIRHPGVLRDFTWPSGLLPFTRFNLIYGRNGSGKTTISRIMRHLENSSTQMVGEATLRIDGEDLGTPDFAAKDIPIRVFNRDFVSESVFRTDGKGVPPIFVLGKDSVDKQKEVEALRIAKSSNDQALNRARDLHEQAEKKLDKFCIRQAKQIKDTLVRQGQGTYNNYNKSHYQDRVGRMRLAGDADTHRLDPTAYDASLLRYRQESMPTVDEVQYHPPPFKSLHENVRAVLDTTTVSSVINTLKGDPILGSWMHQGLELHKRRQSQSCLFCEQKLPAGRIEALEGHFSTAYNRLLQRIDILLEQSENLKTQAQNVSLPGKANLYGDIRGDYSSRKQAVEHTLAAIDTYADALAGLLKEKRLQPFERLQLDIPVPELGHVVSNLNAVIRRHNTVCDDFEDQIRQAGDHVADSLIAESADECSLHLKAVDDAEQDVGRISKEIAALSVDIHHLVEAIRDHRLPAAELNHDLHQYLGHNEIQFAAGDEGTGYTLMRGNSPAKSLSEGETTAIALLYFLRTLTDERFKLEKGVVVLDDPVSSLDSNALFFAFGYIKDRTEDAAQLFVLTHNFTFFRQVKNWFHYTNKVSKKRPDHRSARFYMLDQVVGAKPKATELKQLDSLLRLYESEYHYLFAQVYRRAYHTAVVSLENDYGLANTARRLLEMFLAFRKPSISGQLYHKMATVTFDESKKCRILRFVQTHSHGDLVSESGHDPSILGETESVLKDLMDLMQKEDQSHFDSMVETVMKTADSQ